MAWRCIILTFFGTDLFSVKVLETLFKNGVVPDLIVTISGDCPIRKYAQNIPVIHELEEVKGDLFVVASYGKIIPQSILDIPKYGALNIHPSILPKYRGASPLEATILSGDKETGTTIILMDAKMDYGKIVAIEKIAIDDTINYMELRDKLAILGAEMLLYILPNWKSKVFITEQDHGRATYTKKITKDMAKIDLSTNAEENYRKIRAFADWPNAWFIVNRNGKPTRVIIKKASLKDKNLVLERIVPEGKKEMSWQDFERGNKIDYN